MAGYFFGCIQTAYIIGKIKHIDIRKQGSGNLGATNATRVLGNFWGIFTAVCDILKVFLAEYVIYLILIYGIGYTEVDRITLFLYIGFGVVIGHNFPFYLHFKGGKGVAASAAALISLWDLKMIIIGVIIFFGICFATRYVSLASMTLIASELIIFIILTQSGNIILRQRYTADCYVIVALMAFLVIFQHRDNIARLTEGCERRFSFHRKEK